MAATVKRVTSLRTLRNAVKTLYRSVVLLEPFFPPAPSVHPVWANQIVACTYMWRQNGYYAILADNDIINSYPCNPALYLHWHPR